MESLTLFGGGGGADLGLDAADCPPSAGYELDDRIADVARQNGLPMTTADVCGVDFTPWAGRIGWVHGSPPCTNASQAKTHGCETEQDIRLAQAVIRAIEIIKPPWFSLENVINYRNFESFRLICAVLTSEGYTFDYWHLNTADYGVPQTRRRLFLVASRIAQPRRPEPTHYDARAGHAHMLYQPWCGWYAAIEDLLPSLPDTQPASWQLARMPKHLRESVLVHPTDMRTMPTISGDDPSFTVMAGSGANTWAPRALLFDGGNTTSHNERKPDQPSMTVQASPQADYRRAFLVGGGNTNTTEARDRLPRFGQQPAFTQTQSSNRDRAFVGRWVKITPRCNARFQSFPDTYQLSGTNTLDCRIIGNAVPPLLMRRIVESNK